jgi:hypothetical protein
MRFPGRWVLLGLGTAVAGVAIEDATKATTDRVSHLAVTGPATEAQAAPFAGRSERGADCA